MADKPSEKTVTTLEEALEVGYIGTVPDDTPNEAYTVAGVTKDDTAAKADRAAADRSGTAPAETSTSSTRSRTSNKE